MTEPMQDGEIKREEPDISDDLEENEARYKEYIPAPIEVLVKIETNETMNDFEENQTIKNEKLYIKEEWEDNEARYMEYIPAPKETPVKVETNPELNDLKEMHKISVKDSGKIKNEELDIKEVLDESDTSTDTADEPMDIPLSPPKKRSKKIHFDVNTKEIILNIYKYELEEYPALGRDDIAVRVANKVGVSSRSVYNVLREYSRTHSFAPPMTNKNRKSTVHLVDEADKHAIRRKVYQFFFRNELPTIDKILEEVNDDTNLPNFRRTTFSKLLKKLKFKFQGRGRHSLLLERDEIVLWRRGYLKKIKSYRNEGRKIYYTGETWINAGNTKSSTKASDTSSKQAGKGKRLIICHIGSTDGFLPDSLCTFESKKTGGVHEEMNAQSFENWFSNILPKLEPNSVIVLDNAQCHCRKIEKIPTTAFKKADIQKWLRTKNLDYDDSMLKVQLLSIVNQNKKKFNKYIIDEIAESQNQIVLRLPPYHCELNPIDLVWTDIHNYLAQKNVNFKFSELKNVFLEALSHITADKWEKCVTYVQDKVETRMWELDNIIEAHVEPLSVNVGNSSSSSSESDSE